MANTYKIHKALCESINDKKKEYVDKILNTICKVSVTKRKMELPKKNLGKVEPIIFLAKDEILDKIKCDISKIGELQDTIDEMKALKDAEELIQCR